MGRRSELYAAFLAAGRDGPTTLSDVERELVAEIRRRIRVRSGIGYVTYPYGPEGKVLRRRVTHLRAFYRQGRLRQGLIEALAAIPGWSWSSRNEHSRRYASLLRHYVEKHGWFNLTLETIIDGEKVGSWLVGVRSKFRRQGLNAWLKQELESIPGFEWDGARRIWSLRHSQRMLERNLDTLRRACAAMPSRWTNTSSTSRFEDRKLAAPVGYFRSKYKAGTLAPQVIRQLEQLPGWSWAPIDDVRRRYLALLRDLSRKKGGLPELEHRAILAGRPIGTWVCHVNRLYRRGALEDALRRQLEAIPGWCWKTPVEDRHRKKLALLRQYLEEYELRELKRRRMFRGVNLLSWVAYLRNRFRTGRPIPDWLADELERIPEWSWEPSKEIQFRRRRKQRHWGPEM